MDIRLEGQYDRVTLDQVKVGQIFTFHGRVMMKISLTPSDWVTQHKDWVWYLSLTSGLAQAVSPTAQVIPHDKAHITYWREDEQYHA